MRAGSTAAWNSSKSTRSKVNIVPPSRASVLRPRRGGFELAREPEQGGFVAEPPEGLHPYRQTIGCAVQRYRHGRLPCEVRDRGEAAHRRERVQRVEEGCVGIEHSELRRRDPH